MPVAGITCARCTGQMLLHFDYDLPCLTCIQCGHVRYLSADPQVRREDVRVLFRN